MYVVSAAEYFCDLEGEESGLQGSREDLCICDRFVF